MLKLSDFDYFLPKELIAEYPLKQRDKARLLILNRKDGSIEHSSFDGLLRYLKKDDLLVLNNTKVLPSRLIGNRKTGGKVEVLLLNHKSNLIFNALIKPGRLKIGERISFGKGGVFGEVIARNEVQFCAQDINQVYAQGTMPLPPYIKRDVDEQDSIYYQTVYAKEDGSIAAPTAGLHFTKELIVQLEACGVNVAYVTLHVGYSTFKSVKVEDIAEHKMDPEYFCVNEQAQKLINKSRLEKKRIFAVGTTSLRVLEAYSAGLGQGYTDLFVYPGYEFKIVDSLLTNFHLPRTTLFMLVSAFAGEKLVKKAYQEAIDKKYRFYSYGDAMLII